MELPKHIAKLIEDVARGNITAETFDQIVEQIEALSTGGSRKIDQRRDQGLAKIFGGEPAMSDAAVLKWTEVSGMSTKSQASALQLTAVNELAQNSVEAEMIKRARQKRRERGEPDDMASLAKMYSSRAEAVEDLFGIPGGDLANYEVCYKTQDAFANEVASVIVEFGKDGDVTLKFVDEGCGQPASRIPQTFLGFGDSEKEDFLWLVGRLGAGASIVAQYARRQMILTKEETADGRGQWVVLLMRRIDKVVGGQRVYGCEYLCYEGPSGEKTFPTMPAAAEIVIEKSYRVMKRRIGLGDAWVEEQRVRIEEEYKQKNPNRVLVRMDAQILQPTKNMKEGKRRDGSAAPKYDARIRFVAHALLRHGTLRVLVECDRFTEGWAKKGVGGDTTSANPGLWEASRRAVPAPTAPYEIVENRIGDTPLSVEIGDKVAPAMFGQVSTLSRIAERIPIPVTVEVGGRSMEVELVAFYLDDEEKTLEQYSLNQQRSPFHILLGGQVIGCATRDDAIDIVESSGLVDRFVFYLHIDGLDCHGAVRGLGRMFDPRTPESKALILAAKKAAKKHERIVAIKKDAQKASTPNALASAIIDTLGREDKGVEVMIGEIEACVSGPKECGGDDRPNFAWPKRDPSFKRGHRKDKTKIENLKPFKVTRGRKKKFQIITSCGTARFVERPQGDGEYRMKVTTLDKQPGVTAKWESGDKIAVKVVANAPKAESVFLVHICDSNGFKSTPAVIKVEPCDIEQKQPAEPLELHEEPTYISSYALGNNQVCLVEPTPVKFKADAVRSFKGFMATCTHGGRIYPASVSPCKDGRWAASVPVLDGASVGDKCLLHIHADLKDGSSVLLEPGPMTLTVVAKKTLVGNDAKKGRCSVMIPGGPDDKLEFDIITDESKKKLKMYGIEPDELCGLVVFDGRFIAVSNHVCQVYKNATRRVKAEISKATGVKRLRLDQELKDFDWRLYEMMQGVYMAEKAVAEANGQEIPKAELTDTSMKRRFRCMAQALPLMLDVDPGTGRARRRYDDE